MGQDDEDDDESHDPAQATEWSRRAAEMQAQAQAQAQAQQFPYADPRAQAQAQQFLHDLQRHDQEDQRPRCERENRCAAGGVYEITGEAISLGDYVSASRGGQRGVVRGHVSTSSRAKCGLCGRPALTITAQDGTVYSFSHGARKLKVQK